MIREKKTGVLERLIEKDGLQPKRGCRKSVNSPFKTKSKFPAEDSSSNMSLVL